jgi:hypothetical protein
VVLSQSGAKARTLHSWAGIGVGEKSADTLAKMIKDDSKKRSRWKSAWILVIDEISMLSQELFDLLSTLTSFEEIFTALSSSVLRLFLLVYRQPLDRLGVMNHTTSLYRLF